MEATSAHAGTAQNGCRAARNGGGLGCALSTYYSISCRELVRGPRAVDLRSTRLVNVLPEADRLNYIM